MSTFNKMMAIGNLGSDPEMRYTPSGSPVTSFRIATNRRATGADGERRDETEWFTVVTWNKLAELCNQYLTKGRKVYVEGRLHSRSWEGKDGVTRFVNEIIANQVVFLDRGQVGALPPGDEAFSDNGPQEDLPF